MRYFPIVFLSLMVFVHVYLLLCLRRAFKPGAWQWVGYGIVLLGFCFYYFRGRVGFIAIAPAASRILYAWMGMLIIMCIFLLARDALAIVLRLFSRTAYVPSVRIALLCGLLGFFYGMYETTAIRVRNVTIPTAHLPEGMETLRIVALSDLHIQPYTPISTIDHVVDLANSQNGDIVVVLGDFVDGKYGEDSPQVAALSKLRAKYGKFAVVGNHELYAGYETAVQFIRAAGFRLLQGEIASAAGITIAGVDDPVIPGRTGIAETLAGISDTGPFILLLSHRPEAFADVTGRFDLEIAGHTHGGQIWPARHIVPYLNNGFKQGVTRLEAPPDRPREQSIVYVSNGTRHWGPPVRFLTPPEITVIDLIKEQ